MTTTEPSEFHKHNETDTYLSPRAAAKLASEAAARYYERAHEFRFEPFKSFDQFLVLCLLVAVLLVLLCQWRAVLKCLTGDDTLRIDRFQLLYWGLFQCCGCCDGEWTRCISYNCCCFHPPWRGRNLKRAVGESLGLYPVSIRVQNIVVGSLPQDRYAWFPRKPDLFVQVIADESTPTLNTEVVSEANTECVQFTSSLTLLVKNNASDDPVRFIAKKMNLTGSTELADCNVSPARLVLWARQGRKVRIQMGGPCRREDPLCMPWILMDLSVPPEAKFLRREVGVFTPVIATSAERRSHNSDEASMGLLCTGNHRSRGKGFVQLPVSTATGFAAITDADLFKASYPLVNDKGVEIEMPDEDIVVQAVHNERSCLNVLAAWLLVLGVCYLLVRVFTAGCLEEYRKLEVMWLYCRKRHVPFNASDQHLLRALEDMCKFRPIGFDIVVHLLHTDSRVEYTQDMCFPGLTRTRERCLDLHNASAPLMLGLPCPAWTCSIDNSLEAGDVPFIVFMLASLVVICLCKAWEAREVVLPREAEKPQRRQSMRRVSRMLSDLSPK